MPSVLSVVSQYSFPEDVTKQMNNFMDSDWFPPGFLETPEMLLQQSFKWAVRIWLAEDLIRQHMALWVSLELI